VKTVVKVENISKRYFLNHRQRERFPTMRDAITGKVKDISRKFASALWPIDAADENIEEFWALHDISFEISQGDRLGIIGRNGAGKSTLLKILSRITEPTKGMVTIKGRVASLLEVGTGFHPELSGRENIFLNGAILGMSRGDIRCKFDEIVGFAEVERFLDTPVKRYSSGMYVRLAFAVAAHLDPEILIVDEVLAVGDASFQKKCLGKMEDVGKDGRTVLFVSHNMAAIENLCDKGIVLNDGKMTFSGKSEEAVSHYLNSFSIDPSADLTLRTDRKGEGKARFTRIGFENSQSKEVYGFPIGADVVFMLSYVADSEIKNPRIIIGIYDSMNGGVARLDTEVSSGLPGAIPRNGVITCKAYSINLIPGRYTINVALLSGGVMQDYVPGAAYFEVIGSDYFKTGKSFNENDLRLAKVLYQHEWRSFS